MIKLIILILLLSGCSFNRTVAATLTAKGAKANLYGGLEEGDVLISKTTQLNIFQKRCKDEE